MLTWRALQDTDFVFESPFVADWQTWLRADVRSANLAAAAYDAHAVQLSFATAMARLRSVRAANADLSWQ